MIALLALAMALAAPAPVIAGTVAIASEDGVGSLSAGKLCLPKGRLRTRDFVASGDAFQLLLNESAQALGNRDRLRSSAISLTAIDARLCAKGWGAFGTGDTQALSGKAAFRFEWVPTGSDARQSRLIDIAFDGKGARPPEDYLREAVRRLLMQLADTLPDD